MENALKREAKVTRGNGPRHLRGPIPESPCWQPLPLAKQPSAVPFPPAHRCSNLAAKGEAEGEGRRGLGAVSGQRGQPAGVEYGRRMRG